MNRERMFELAEEIERPKKLAQVMFDMADFMAGLVRPGSDGIFRVKEERNECGTAACIGGYACLLWGEPGDPINSVTAERLLDLDEDEAGKLFFNNHEFIRPFDLPFSGDGGITRAEAAEALRRMALR